MRVTFSAIAKADLMDIAVYIAQDSPARALTFLGELEDHCRLLALSPRIGPLRPELGEGIRMTVHGRYLAFYRVDGQELRIVRVLHSARDITDGDLSEDDPPPGREP